jgi:hypothetical protein
MVKILGLIILKILLLFLSINITSIESEMNK